MQRQAIVLFLGWLSKSAPLLLPEGTFGMEDFTGRPMDYRIQTVTGVHIINAQNYPVEVHTVRTKDDYVLDVFRIPSSKFCFSKEPKPVVFLNHGMTSSADTFLLTGSKHGLPFMLADNCFDVWLGNARGTRYSRRHLTLQASENSFWRFSWHEIGLLDLSAVLEYIMAYTRQRAVHYVGHSQGCTSLLVLLSLRPEFNQHIKTVHFLAPAVFMRNTDFLALRLLAPLIVLMPDREFGPHLKSVNLVLGAICKLMVIREICTSLYMFSNGKVSQHFDRSIIPLLVATHPAGISSRQPKHFLQVKASDRFQQFDFGFRGNKKVYNRSTPPEYPLERVRPLSPIHIFYSDWDTAVNSKDILRLTHVLPNVVMHPINLKTWEHNDFMYATTAHIMVNEPIISSIQYFEKTGRGWTLEINNY